MFFLDWSVLSSWKISGLTVQPFAFFCPKMPYFLSFLWEKNISYSWSRTWQFYLPQSNWVWDPLQRSLSAFPALGWVECKSIAFGCEKNRATGKCWQILEDRVGILKYTSSNGPPECCPSHPKQVVEVRGRQRGRSNYNTLHQVLPGASIIIVGMVAVMVKGYIPPGKLVYLKKP